MECKYHLHLVPPSTTTPAQCFAVKVISGEANARYLVIHGVPSALLEKHLTETSTASTCIAAVLHVLSFVASLFVPRFSREMKNDVRISINVFR